MSIKTGTFDGTSYTVSFSEKYGTEITVTEGETTITLCGGDFVRNAAINCDAVADMCKWTRDRIVYVFGLAARAI